MKILVRAACFGFLAAVISFPVVLVFTRDHYENNRAAALTECNTLGGTLIISADERYICVPDAVEVGK